MKPLPNNPEDNINKLQEKEAQVEAFLKKLKESPEEEKTNNTTNQEEEQTPNELPDIDRIIGCGG